jgi:xanthine dehydrogenase accessory factor
MEEGITREVLDKIYAPIGMAIEAETPEEIAVSIVGELILARARNQVHHA